MWQYYTGLEIFEALR